MKYKQLRSIAAKTRRTMEKIRNGLYSPNNCSYVSHTKDLGGLCGYGSVLLYENLTREGFSPEIVSGSGHWFVKCDEYLMDVTASQFGQSKVVVRNYNKIQEGIKKAEYNRYFWSELKRGTPEFNGLGGHIEIVHRQIAKYENTKKAK